MKMNMKLVCALLAICIAVAILGWIFRTGREKPHFCESHHKDWCLKNRGHDGHSLVFADLTPKEMVQVKKYLWNNLGVPLVAPPLAKPSHNCIYSIVLHLPPKAEVLEFLDHQGRKPTRQALAVVYFGNQEDPNVTEYVVGPLPKPTYHQDITVQKYGGKLPYYRRYLLRVDSVKINVLFIGKEYPKAPNFMRWILDYNVTNLLGLPALPPGFESGDRKVWMRIFQNVAGFYLHPVGLELQMDVSSLNVSEWKVLNVFYNGQYFRDMEELEREFNAGRVRVVKVKKAPLDGGYSSLKPRVPPKSQGPLQYEPRGPRYCIRDNQVTFMSWSFAFGMEANRGPRIFDVRFQGERIVYELSIQDASALYGSNSPAIMVTRLMDLGVGFGRSAVTLTRGVDCPYVATYLDGHYFLDSSRPITRKNSLCIFEQNAEIPLRRHYEDHVISEFYGALADSVLVFRSISVMGNYDYIWDFVFHQNGAVGIRVHASGYIQASFFFGDAADFGNRVEDLTLGTIHTHSIHYKVDLDIGGAKNYLVTNDMTFTKVKAPWDQEHEINQIRLVRDVLETEDKAAFRLHDDLPRNIYFAANSTNRWGHDRGYRIQIHSFSGDHLPESDPMERAISWGR
ncbi:UNVERIFIED_CONTAM: hypothetical protein K2H54_007045 [Gekko kuhli]